MRSIYLFLCVNFITYAHIICKKNILPGYRATREEMKTFKNRKIYIKKRRERKL